MCGIYGTYGFVDLGLMRSIGRSLRHRGPDEEGELVLNGPDLLFLGHRRLSIIDLEGGRQPIFNEAGDTAVVFNGEIYNFRELRKELQALGHIFTTRTDTEVLVHAWEAWGTDSFLRFNGIFAFALWDGKLRQLVLVRDRMGVKPLYFSHSGGRLAFASELRPLLDLPWVDRERLDAGKIAEFMVFRHTSAEQTVVRGIEKLSPGGWLIVNADGLALGRYWALRYAPEPMDPAEALAGFSTRLRSAVHSQLVADVPVGVMLSGGIDSGAITALAAEAKEDLHTFSIGFAGDPLSELEDARRVAERFGTRHAELTIQPGDLDMVPEIICRNDEPVAGPSSLAYYLMLEKVRQAGIKVVLLGHGADEILGGYEHLRILSRLRRLCSSPLAPVAGAGLRLGRAIFPGDECLARTERLFRNAKDWESAYLSLYAVFDSPELGRLFRSGHAAPRAGFNPLARLLQQQLSGPDAIMAYEHGPWLADDLLHRVDRMCMAHSIEGRVPYLDNELVEFCARTPYGLKYSSGRDKDLLRRAMRDILPTPNLFRKKQRFTTPVDRFFGDRFLSACRRLFAEDNYLNNEVFETTYLLSLLNFQSRPSYRYALRFHRLFSQFYSRQIWSAFTLHIWYKTVVQQIDCAYLFHDPGAAN
jgi:asparagine synthase (glutamine-hydrolysing)